MAFVFAFLIGGCVCAIGQLVKELKVPFPVAMVLFIALGGILTPVGLMGWLASLGAGGVVIFACGLGNAAYSTGAAAAAGAPQGMVILVVLLVVLIALGAVLGVGKKLPPMPDPAEEGKE